MPSVCSATLIYSPPSIRPSPRSPILAASDTSRPSMPLLRRQGYWEGEFVAMASPCVVLAEVDTAAEARRLLDIARAEAQRIEARFSRYRQDNIVHCINTSAGQPVEVDDETALLLDYAARCHGISEGRFDITSGVLRRAWRFDRSDWPPE